MNNDTLRLLLLSACGFGLLSWLVNGWLVRVAGIWEKIVDDGESPERIRLWQTGPVVRGERLVHGGRQLFSGYVLGGVLHLKRRDVGLESLMKAGFPLKIAPLVDGKITGNLKLRLANEGASLIGAFEPVKIAFTQQPPRLTGTEAMPSTQVAYTRLLGVHDEKDAHLRLPRLLADADPVQKQQNKPSKMPEG
ncbi:MAG: hypothetical protein GY822_01710 [Deltaproteobacteria bacterium]|nr:hypothetical protein [Deltaproteobacteria bacterium]